VKSKDQFMSAYSAGRSAYQYHAMYDMEPWEAWACVALLAVGTSSSEILLERYTSLPWRGRQGISSVALALFWGVMFAIPNRRRAGKRD
jgi:hypothetical protein